MINQNRWKELVSEFYHPIFIFCLRFLGNREEAEDLTQEVFIKAYSSLCKKEIEEPLIKNWLYKIARNSCIDKTRWWKRTARVKQGLTNAANGMTTEPMNPAIFLENEILKLPVRQREVFILRHWHEFSTCEVAQLLKITEGSVKSHLNRAIEKLKASLVSKEVI